ncbi:MAG TPA: alanine--tRNA ligase [Gammaproteobacteria bacterium]|nr:alanine--tRNA ligase [Gammaproteobacteria bacterium]
MATLAQLRASFLDFFKRRGHEVVASSSLVPGNDPTLLFTNAGMVQFKDVFLGLEKRPYVRAASSQRCVRAGGKHNDLENVGFTARHHTFFEMLGNFSFGDYFKEDAIKYAWEFLTGVLKLPPEKLWVTVYAEDTEAADIWLKKIGVDKNRFARIATKDNFWQMGDTGPCGPCSEIFYDHGPGVAGGPPGSPEADGDRYIEIWNLVFMQYNRSADGKLTPLPKPSVDTGMGLERLAAVMQGVHSNYEIDLFRNLLDAVARAVGVTNEGQSSLRVIADHIRSCSFLIADGVVPSNEGRGYVLRRIIRRAIRHGHKLGCKDAFFHKLVKPLAREMGDAYPELASAQAMIERTLKNEEERFAQTLENGLLILNETFLSMRGKTVPGDIVFKLYDTYGFPVDLTADIARERGYQLDTQGFEKAMEEQRALARSSSQFGTDMSRSLDIKTASEFIGYDHLHGRSEIKHLLRDNEPVDSLNEGESGIVVLATTPFYAESGGQVGDRGELIAGGDARFRVEDTQKHGDAILHIGRMVSGSLRKKAAVSAQVDARLRTSTIQNHSATHLLHAALRQVLGSHVQQKGSLVNEHRLRFDFSHTAALTADEIRKIELLVNEQIQVNHQAQAQQMSLQDAKKSGAMALFGEKYGDRVRVLSMGNFSVELCGGTHVSRTGDIGLFRIISESGVAAGVRRIEAVTGMNALNLIYQTEARLDRVGAAVKADREQVETRVLQLAERNRELEKELQKLKARLAERSTAGSGAGITEQAVEIGGVKLVAETIEGADSKILRDTLDQLKQKLKTAVIVLGAIENERVLLVAGVTKDTVTRVHAGELVNYVAEQVGGRGGGRPDMAQAGGTNPAALKPALESVKNWVASKLV